MLTDLRYLNTPETVIAIILVFLVISNLIGEILEFKGKVVPEFIKMRKYFQRRSKEKKAISKMHNTKTITKLTRFTILTPS